MTVSQSVSQSVIQSFSLSVSQSDRQPGSHTVRQSVSQSVSQSVCLSACLSVYTIPRDVLLASGAFFGEAELKASWRSCVFPASASSSAVALLQDLQPSPTGSDRLNTCRTPLGRWSAFADWPGPMVNGFLSVCLTRKERGIGGPMVSFQ